ncbi:putative permease [Thermanaerovibrio velox DSM 12556]|uniref:Putative permease n=1 Tax=Thermanaerovibrio velox DSM 12556 TaxID=926567 RepID=H0UR78_9BACT|nr:permease [Thermanaerovibrio velox]EHM09834.1 putative permease [Thermanaerovibrio velox DSM 12556]
MRAVVYRYRFFLSVALVAVGISLFKPHLGRGIIVLSLSNLKEMLSIIPPIFVLLGLLDVWVDRSTMMRFTGPGSGLKGVLVSFLMGSAAAGPLYAAFPVAEVMISKGASMFNVMVFLGAWSTTKIPLLMFEMANMGYRFTVTRLVMSIAGILLIARLLDSFIGPPDNSTN